MRLMEGEELAMRPYRQVCLNGISDSVPEPVRLHVGRVTLAPAWAALLVNGGNLLPLEFCEQRSDRR